ncbi:hypothetical protein WA026_019890 [Henosepilachna vigintioctopunctata]|uniref:Ribosomal protein L14 n=1 Tax=Henosepilachna vigintioctopunctata TaxID=420089 RepID=A0AAW1VFC4_9CUCU
MVLFVINFEITNLQKRRRILKGFAMHFQETSISPCGRTRSIQKTKGVARVRTEAQVRQGNYINLKLGNGSISTRKCLLIKFIQPLDAPLRFSGPLRVGLTTKRAMNLDICPEIWPVKSLMVCLGSLNVVARRVWGSQMGVGVAVR